MGTNSKEKARQYYEASKDKLKEAQHCAPCNMDIQAWNMSKHKKSARHQKNCADTKTALEVQKAYFGKEDADALMQKLDIALKRLAEYTNKD
jgi:hypothetical protein